MIRITFKLLIVVCFCVVLSTSGCGNRAAQSEAAGSVLVQYQAKPLANVQVIVYFDRGADWQAVLHGTTDLGGKAILQELPMVDDWKNDPKAKLRVTLESIGDGDWLIKGKYSNPQSSDVTLLHSDLENSPLIELPKGAIQSL